MVKRAQTVSEDPQRLERKFLSSFVNKNLMIDSRTPQGQHEGTILSDVTKERPPTSARPIRKVIKFFEDHKAGRK